MVGFLERNGMKEYLVSTPHGSEKIEIKTLIRWHHSGKMSISKVTGVDVFLKVGDFTICMDVSDWENFLSESREYKLNKILEV